MRLSPHSLRTLHPLSRRMVDDAWKQVMEQGKCFTHPNSIEGYLGGDQFRSFTRSLNRNKGKFMGSGLKFLAAGLLAGPVGLAAGVGAAVALPVVRYLWRSVRKNRARNRIDQHSGTVWRTVEVEATDARGQKVTQQELHVDNSWEEIMEDVGYLCRHGEMTKVLDACVELGSDYEIFSRRYASDAAVGARFGSCDEAWAFLEQAARVGYRFQGLAAVSDLMLSTNEFIVAERSRMDDAFESTRTAFILAFVQTAGSDSMDIMQAAANSSEVFNHSFFTKKDYSAWIKAQVGQILQRDMGGTTHSAAFDASSAAQRTGAGTLGKGVAVGGASRGASSAAVAAINHADARTAVLGNLNASSGGLAGSSLSAAAAGGINAGIGIVVDVAVESLTRYLHMRELKALWEKKERLDSEGIKEYDLHQHFSSTDLEVLRTNAKELNEKLIEKLAHLIVAHREYTAVHASGGTAQVRAKAFLRRQKLSGQVDVLYKAYQMFIFFFFARANYIDATVQKLAEDRLPKLDACITQHGPAPCEGLCCYANSEPMLGFFSKLLGIKLVSATDPSRRASSLSTTNGEVDTAMARSKWLNVPFNPVPGSPCGLAELVK